MKKLKLSNVLYNLSKLFENINKNIILDDECENELELIIDSYEKVISLDGEFIPENNVEFSKNIIEFLLDNFHYFKSDVFDYSVEQILTLCPHLILNNRRQIYDELINNYKLVENSFVSNLDNESESDYSSPQEFDNRKEFTISNPKHKKSLPSNVSEWLKSYRGDHNLDSVKKLMTWHNKLTGRNFVGGTSIGKSPQTLILDITYQGSEIYVSFDEIKFKDVLIEDEFDYEKRFNEVFKLSK